MPLSNVPVVGSGILHISSVSNQSENPANTRTGGQRTDSYRPNRLSTPSDVSPNCPEEALRDGMDPVRP